MINYIVYSNTDYLDVLKIQTDYMQNIGNLSLFINKNDLDLSEIYSKYDNVIFYDGNDTYAKRLMTCLNQIDFEYFVLIHDIDILLKVKDETIINFFDFIKKNNVDRIDLKYTEKTNDIIEFDLNGLFLVPQKNENNFIYNVNPSIWKKSALLDIVTSFQHKTYRTIEDIDVQIFAKKFNVYKLNKEPKISCGYFNCVDDFIFLHISHSGKFLTLPSNFVTEYGQSYGDIANEYVKIVEKYNLKNSNKWNR